MRLCIIADDLTGALDSAAPFAGRGLTVEVALSPDATAKVASGGAQVVAVTTCSRDGDEAAAREAIATVLAALPRGVPILKKIDSRLKGHIAAELSVLDPSRMLFAPAIPDFGRITRDGLVQGHGIDQPLSIADRLGTLASRAVIPDITTAEQMNAALDLMLPGDLLVGARGLAEALAIRMSKRPDASPALVQAERSLLVIGSRDPITLAQVDRVRASGMAVVLDAPLGEVGIRVPSVPHLLVQAVPGKIARSGAQVAEALAQSAHPALTNDRQALVLSGGATAEAVLRHMGIKTLHLAGECLPGLALARSGKVKVVAKSGGFGNEATLVTLLEMFHGRY